MSVKDDATALSTELGVTVYYGFDPDAVDGTLDTCVTLIDDPLQRPDHDFGNALPALSYYGVAVHARDESQDAARDLCASAYEALLSRGYTALYPPVSLGRQQGRFEAVAAVEAHTVRS